MEYSKSLPLVEKTIKATSASQRIEISCAFLSNPERRFENVTCLLILFSILFSWTLPLPMIGHRETQERKWEKINKQAKLREKINIVFVFSLGVLWNLGSIFLFLGGGIGVCWACKRVRLYIYVIFIEKLKTTKEPRWVVLENQRGFVKNAVELWLANETVTIG